MHIQNFYFKLCIINIVSLQTLQAMEYPTALVRKETGEHTQQKNPYSAATQPEALQNFNSFPNQGKSLPSDPKQDLKSLENNECKNFETLLSSSAEKPENLEEYLAAAAYYYHELQDQKPAKLRDKKSQKTPDELNFNMKLAVQRYITTSKKSAKWQDQLSLAQKYLKGESLQSTTIFIKQNYQEALKCFERSLEKANTDSPAVRQIMHSFVIDVQDGTIPLEIKLNYLTSLFNQEGETFPEKALQLQKQLTQWSSPAERIDLQQRCQESEIYGRLESYQIAQSITNDSLQAALHYRKAGKPNQEIACIQKAATTQKNPIAQMIQAGYSLTGYHSIVQNYTAAITQLSNVLKKHNTIESLRDYIKEFDDSLQKQDIMSLNEKLLYSGLLLSHKDPQLIDIGLANVEKIIKEHTTPEDVQIVVNSNTFAIIQSKIQSKRQKNIIPATLKQRCVELAEKYQPTTTDDSSKQFQEGSGEESPTEQRNKLATRQKKGTLKKKGTKQITINKPPKSEFQRILTRLKKSQNDDAINPEQIKTDIINLFTKYYYDIKPNQCMPERFTQYAHKAAQHMISTEVALTARNNFFGQISPEICATIDDLQENPSQPAIAYLKGVNAFYHQRHEDAQQFLSHQDLQGDLYAQTYRALIACKQKKASLETVQTCIAFLHDDIGTEERASLNKLVEVTLERITQQSLDQEIITAANVGLLKYNVSVFKERRNKSAKVAILNALHSFDYKDTDNTIFSSLRDIISNNEIKNAFLQLLARAYIDDKDFFPGHNYIEDIIEIAPELQYPTTNKLLSKAFRKCIDSTYNLTNPRFSEKEVPSTFYSCAERAYMFDPEDKNSQFYRGVAMLYCQEDEINNAKTAEPLIAQTDEFYKLRKLHNLYSRGGVFLLAVIEKDTQKALDFGLKALQAINKEDIPQQDKDEMLMSLHLSIAELYDQKESQAKVSKETTVRMLRIKKLQNTAKEHYETLRNLALGTHNTYYQKKALFGLAQSCISRGDVKSAKALCTDPILADDLCTRMLEIEMKLFLESPVTITQQIIKDWTALSEKIWGNNDQNEQLIFASSRFDIALTAQKVYISPNQSNCILNTPSTIHLPEGLRAQAETLIKYNDQKLAEARNAILSSFNTLIERAKNEEEYPEELIDFISENPLINHYNDDPEFALALAKYYMVHKHKELAGNTILVNYLVTAKKSTDPIISLEAHRIVINLYLEQIKFKIDNNNMTNIASNLRALIMNVLTMHAQYKNLQEKRVANDLDKAADQELLSEIVALFSKPVIQKSLNNDAGLKDLFYKEAKPALENILQNTATN